MNVYCENTELLIEMCACPVHRPDLVEKPEDPEILNPGSFTAKYDGWCTRWAKKFVPCPVCS